MRGALSKKHRFCLETNRHSLTWYLATAFDAGALTPLSRALSALSADDQTAWHMCYCPQEGLEMRARATLANVKPEMRATGAEVTIHALWVELADRAGRDDEPAAALTKLLLPATPAVKL